ncbi:uncharacterized protein RCC_07724 [Ramularia collo-cygni]|uniref:Uncharacterized protein n=1 Tax=Ramularia collo-cygni TaxID=112498 RepID=A0A2D3VAN6_9PEZI|nr:uncharacterized protein RCC_07724 [Ramularia collo-cygni]CZT21857.1 uncharacterized protein RCC_07724 [Ramularia collo-cygni]
MQSSPPTRAHLPATSPTASEYSLDLNALGSDGDTDTSIPKPRMDRVFSEDIDGPSDFTQNMDMWMRGGSLRKKANANPGSQAQTQTQTINTQEDVGETREQHEEDQYGDGEGDGDGDDQSQQSLLHVPANSHEEEKASAGNHTPENTPPKVSGMENDEHQFSSEWHTYGSASTPVPPVHKQFLQPTVEDHHSELTPARHTPGHTVRGRPTRSFHDMQRRSSLREEESTPGRASSPTFSPVRSPVVQRRTSGQTIVNDQERDNLESQLRQLHAKCEQLEQLNSALKNALDEESRIRRQERAEFDAHMKEAARRERDLTEMKEAAYQHNDDFRRQFGEMNEKLHTTTEKSEEQAKLARTGAQEMVHKHAAEVERLKGLLSRQTLQHKQELQSLKQDLELARRNTNNAEATSRVHKEDLNTQREDHDLELERMQAELQNERDDEGVVSELERLLKTANDDIRRLTEASGKMKEEVENLRDALAKVKRGHDEEATRMAAERTRAVDLAAGLQRQVQDLKTQFKDVHAGHGEEVQKMKAAHGLGNETSSQELEVVRRELDAKQTELNEAILERDDAVDELESSKAEQEELRNQLEELEALNIELDARVSETVRRREEVWRKKLEKADEERKVMVKTLLHQWGREELGKESPQRYAYKHTSSPAKG